MPFVHPASTWKSDIHSRHPQPVDSIDLTNPRASFHRSAGSRCGSSAMHNMGTRYVSVSVRAGAAEANSAVDLERFQASFFLRASSRCAWESRPYRPSLLLAGRRERSERHWRRGARSEAAQAQAREHPAEVQVLTAILAHDVKSGA
eukprot:scaffold1187_cov258-Pinguiococcus_pyrenoidosus.AAC.20